MKLYLWLWWHDQHIRDPGLLGLRWTAAAWAQLLALDEHETNGARAVRGQLKWLEQNRYVVRDGRRPPHIQALNVDGRAFPLDTDRSELYIGLPDSFWTGGWITRLSPRAIASLFIVMDYAKPRIRISDATTAPQVFIHEGELAKHYRVSVDYFHDGLDELEYRKLITTTIDKKWHDEGGYGGRWSTIALDVLRGAAS